jgi:hypothetical protein
MRTRLLPLAAILAARLVALLPALPAVAITTVADSPFAGNSPVIYLSVSAAVGQNVMFYSHDTGQYVTELDYQAEGNNYGISYYYIHPAGHDSICLTANTNVFGNMKAENCVHATNQYWYNVVCNPFGIYYDQSLYYAGDQIYALAHSNGSGAGLTGNGSCGSSGWDFLQG